MTKRLTITIEDDVYSTLEVWADEEVRSVANLAAALVTMAARERQNKQKTSSEQSEQE